VYTLTFFRKLRDCDKKNNLSDKALALTRTNGLLFFIVEELSARFLFNAKPFFGNMNTVKLIRNNATIGRIRSDFIDGKFKRHKSVLRSTDLFGL
jgi:hypothetical protein